MRSISLTIGIPTRNRLLPLLNLLDSLLRQTIKHYHLIISDDGDLYDVTYWIKKKFPGLTYQYIKGPGINAPLNRQTILEHTKTPYLLLCDDDHYLKDDCTEKLLRTIQSSRKIGLASSVWPEGKGEWLDYRKIKDHPEYRLDLNDLNSSSHYHWKRGDQLFFYFHKNPKLIESQHAGGGCVIYSKQSLLDAGGFPYEYSSLSFRDDTDISHRIHLMGYRVLIQPLAIAYHRPYCLGGIRNDERSESFRKKDGELFLKKLERWRKQKESGKAIDSSSYAAEREHFLRQYKNNMIKNHQPINEPLTKMKKRMIESVFNNQLEQALFLASQAAKAHGPSLFFQFFYRLFEIMFSVSAAQYIREDNPSLPLSLDSIRQTIRKLDRLIKIPLFPADLRAGTFLLMSNLAKRLKLHKQAIQFGSQAVNLLFKKRKKTLQEEYRIAVLYQQISEDKKAEKIWVHLIKKWQTNPKKFPPKLIENIFIHLMQMRKKMHSQSLEAYYFLAMEYAKKMSSSDDQELYQKASFYEKLGEIQSAQKLFFQLLHQSDKTAFKTSSCFHLGELMLIQNKIREAKAYFHRCLKSAPNHQSAFQYLKRINKIIKTK
ncbi:MAG: glycosyltransferase family 2 protein [Candidatus Aureabacteria bacterium]|nr:glycosyltransferase family 2 protein [Candidatus Auribacterota bacterium]